MDTSTDDPLVHVDSQHPYHANMFRTLDLLKIESVDGPIYFAIEGCSELCSLEELRERLDYTYNEGTCPTNFIRIPLICADGNTDPHGVFEFVDSVWMTESYVEAAKVGRERDWIVKRFPQMGAKPDH